MKPDIPSPPCPAPTAAKACFSSHKRCTIERLSLSLFRSPSFFYSSMVLVLPVGKARCQPLPKARAECPHPLCKCFTTSPTHTFNLCPPTPPHLLLRSFIYLFHLLLCNPPSLSCTPYCCCTSTIPLSAFCCFTLSLLPVACTRSISVAIHLPASLTPLPLTPWNSVSLSFSPCLSLSHSLTHPDSNLYTHSSAVARQASAETPFTLSLSSSIFHSLFLSTHAAIHVLALPLKGKYLFSKLYFFFSFIVLSILQY